MPAFIARNLSNRKHIRPALVAFRDAIKAVEGKTAGQISDAAMADLKRTAAALESAQEAVGCGSAVYLPRYQTMEHGGKKPRYTADYADDMVAQIEGEIHNLDTLDGYEWEALDAAQAAYFALLDTLPASIRMAYTHRNGHISSRPLAI
jgi:hypothetical protein